MKRTIPLRLLSLFVLISTLLNVEVLVGQPYSKDRVKPVKNVIFMIADGASLATMSMARWYQRTMNEKEQRLHLDPYLSGTILTYCSNAPIGDSAPTTSCYMTGIPSLKGFVSTYPYSVGKDDLIPLDTTRAYSPVMTLMEATRIEHGRKLGLVFTCELPHATPADCAAHSYRRAKYDWIVPQMVHNGLDVVIGGGASLITPEHRAALERQGCAVFLDDIKGMREHQEGKIWSLFDEMDVPFDLDRDPAVTPSLAEMTETAIRHLDGEKGFMLMVEGSKVDWAAHSNDPVGLATEFLAFDKACKVALDFAKKDGNTVVIITTDHGNSGVSIGVRHLKNYAGTSQETLFGPLTRIRKTSDGLADILQKTPYKDAPAIFLREANITLTDEEFKNLALVEGYEQSPIPEEQRKESTKNEDILYAGSLSAYVAHIYRERMYFGFTTFGHTGEEVFLAVYAPEGTERMTGFNTNIELHEYMHALLGLDDTMIEMSDKYFVPHTKVFEGMKYSITGKDVTDKRLTVRFRGKTMVIEPFINRVMLNKSVVESAVPAIYVDKNHLFYVDKHLADLLREDDND